MTERSDAEKIHAALDELKPWAEDEISHLERQFEARDKSVYLPYKVRSRANFIGGLISGLIIAAVLLWFYPKICHYI
jgi:hypothetical protein